MKRTLILAAILAILGFVFLFINHNREDKKTARLLEEMSFAVEDTDQISKILLADHRNNRILLERKDGYWLFDEKYRANPNAIRNLLDAIKKVKVKFRPPKKAEKTMVESLATEGIKVELYSGDEAPFRTYYVGGSTADERGTYMIMEGSEQPFVTHIPNWVGNLRFRYSLVGTDWRDKSLFSVKKEHISTLSVEYPKQKNKSFTIEKEGNGFVVKPFYETTPAIRKAEKAGSMDAYLQNYESIIAEAFDNKNPDRDSIAALLPFSIIRLADQHGKEKEIRLYPISPPTLQSKEGELITNSQIERFYIATSEGDFLLIQNRVINKILWAYQFFFEA